MGLGQSAVITTNNEGFGTYSQITGRMRPVKIGHTWRLNNFPALCEQNKTGLAVVSPAFAAGDLDGVSSRYKWRLVLYPNGDSEKNSNFVSLYLQLVEGRQDGNSLAVKNAFTLAIIDAGGRQVNQLKPGRKHCFVEGRTLWGYGKFVCRQKLLETNADSSFLQGSGKSARLTIFCENSTLEETCVIPAECNLLHTIVCESVLKASSDFGALLQDSQHSDVTIRTSCGEEFRAHKVILAARSAVFAAMFQHDMREKSENVIYVEDLRRDILEEVLRFIYSGNVRDLEGLVFELLAAADKYALDDLKVMCEEVLCKDMSIDTATELLVFADLHNASSLKARVEAFLIEFSKQVVETPTFKAAMVSHPHLIAEVFRKMALQQ